MSRLVFEDLVLEYEVEEGAVRCVDGVQLQVPEGKVTALIGESGSGKTTLSNAVLRLLAPNARVRRGRILVDGVDVLGLSPEEVRRFRWHRASLVFQAAQSAFNPTLTLGEQLRDAVADHGQDPEQAPFPERIRELLGMVRLDPARVLPAWPHQLSGGMRQRVAIAMALVLHPQILILDEPTTALDLITQSYVQDILQEVHRTTGVTMLFITHDLAAVARLADFVGVMYGGRLVEFAPAESVLRHPRHPYSRALLASVPRVDGRGGTRARGALRTPDLLHPPQGCNFAPGCPRATERCVRERPVLEDGVACFLPEVDS
jgi:peptide/nickel transport system ATP-binding protein